MRQRERYQTHFEKDDPRAENRTKAGEAEATDINVLVRRGIPPIDPAQMSYLDCVALPDYLEAHQLVASMQSEFEGLPATVRDYFKNKPANLVELMNAVADGEASEAELQYLRANGLIQDDVLDAYYKSSITQPNPSSPPNPSSSQADSDNDDESNDDE